MLELLVDVELLQFCALVVGVEEKRGELWEVGEDGEFGDEGGD